MAGQTFVAPLLVLDHRQFGAFKPVEPFLAEEASYRSASVEASAALVLLQMEVFEGCWHSFEVELITHPADLINKQALSVEVKSFLCLLRQKWAD